jgi:DNA polymerase III psi subunit
MNMDNTAREIIDITPEQGKKALVKQEALAIPERARLIVVVDQATMDEADAFFGVIKAMEKKIESVYKPLLDSAMEVKRAAEANRKKVADDWEAAKAPCVEATNYLNPMMYKFKKKQEEERRLEQLRLEAEARKQEEERRLREAELLEQMGEHEEAARVIEEPVTVSVPVAPKPQAPSNFVAKENWQFEITDIDKLPRKYMVADEVMIRAEVKRMKGKTSISGVRVWDAGTVASRSR